MAVQLVLLIFLLVETPAAIGVQPCEQFITMKNSWDGGFDGIFSFIVPNTVSSWELTVEFDGSVRNLNFHNGKKLLGDGCHFQYTDKGFNGIKKGGTSFKEHFVYDYPWDQDPKPKIRYIKFIGDSTTLTCGTPQQCGGATPPPLTTRSTKPTISSAGTTKSTPTRPTTTTEGVTETTSTPVCNGKHDLRKLLQMSTLFYKAQRAGALPDNDVPWRRDSFLNDGSNEGHDLAGGYFDAGDYVKFGFPMAAAATLIAWGLVEFEDGYKYAGQHAKGLETLKWATDYFIKAHTAPNELYGQCGLGGIDHSFWGRPEEFPANKQRPCMKISASNGGGSDLAGETAAALAAASLAFSSTNPSYSTTLLQHARQLYTFAKSYQQSYTQAISDAGKFYGSWSGYKDELAWAAAWMYKATGKAAYKTDAQSFWNQMQQNPGEFSWDNKGRGVAVLLANLISSTSTYKSNANRFCSQDFPNKPKTPRGIVFIQQWGSNRHAANVAFLCLVHSKYQGRISSVENFARQQIDLMLGDQSRGIRSYVVGYGYNPPTKPHHRSSSCPNTGTCNDRQQYAAGPNPQILYGALVGGDTSTGGGYVDDRTNYITNEVAVDYNAGFQSALAGLLSLESKGDCEN